MGQNGGWLSGLVGSRSIRVWSVLPVPLWDYSRFSCFLPHSQTMKLLLDTSVCQWCVSCEVLVTRPGCIPPPPPSSPHQWPCSSLIGRMVIRYINNAQLYVCETKFRLSVNQRHKHKTRRSVFLTDLMIVWCRARSWGHHTQRSTQSF